MNKRTWVDTHEDEILTDNSKIDYCKQCVKCIFKDERGHDRAVCMIYKSPGHKPLHVINNNGICEYFNDEEDAE